MELLHNRYEIIKRLSDTTVFEVYLCKDIQTGINVSVYKLKESFIQDLSFVKGLTQGIIDCKDLNHPNTLRFIDVDADEENESLAFIYEYADGVSLKEVFARQNKLPLQKSIEIGINVLQSLDNAHLMGICHGDLYSDDVLITQDGHVKIRGYGRKDGIEVSSVAKEHLSLETIKYQSPEVLENQGVYEASDVYSLGIILYQMLTGKVPFDGNTSVEIATKTLRDAPLSPRMINRELSASLSSLILESIQKEYNARVGTASIFISRLTDALRCYKQGEYAGPKETVLIKHEEETKKSKLPMMILLFVVVVALAAMIGVSVNGGKKITMPNLVGLTEEDAISKLQGLKINFEKGDEKFSDEYVAGIVCDQSPKSGDKISKREKIQYYVSKGIENVQMPYIIGLDYTTAKEKLAIGNFDIQLEEEFSNSVPDGTVIRTIPDSNTTLENGARVVVTVSKGNRKNDYATPDYTNSDKGRDTSSYDGEYNGEEREVYRYEGEEETPKVEKKNRNKKDRKVSDEKTVTKKESEITVEIPKENTKSSSNSGYSSSSTPDATVEF